MFKKFRSFTLLIFLATLLVACGGSNNNENEDPGDSQDRQVTNTAPDAPTNLQAIEVTQDSVTLSWDAVADIDHYEIYLDGDLAQQNAVDIVQATISDLPKPFSDYVFKVLACDKVACSDDTATLTVRTLLQTPTVNVTVETDCDGLGGPGAIQPTYTLVISWLDIKDEDRYEIFRDQDYQTVFATVSADETTYRDGDFDGENGANFEIRACNGDSCSALDAPDSVPLIEDCGSDTIPLPPRNFTLTLDGLTTHVLTWDDVSNEDHYLFETYVGNPTPHRPTTTEDLPADTARKEITGVAPLQTYLYRLYACNRNDECSLPAEVTYPDLSDGGIDDLQ